MFQQFLIGEPFLDLGCRSSFKKAGKKSGVKFTYDSLTDTLDIASLPASLFSTPVKLSILFY
jgi:hypothetical protein